MSDQRAERLADDYWAYHRSTAQFWNIDRGDVEQIAHWEDLSPVGVAERVQRLGEFAKSAEALAAIVTDDNARAITAAVGFSARANAATLPYVRDVTLVAGMFNLTEFLTTMVPGYRLTTRRHGEGYVGKLRAFPSFVEGWMAGLREGARVGRVATARGVARIVAELDAMLVVDPSQDALAGQLPPDELSERESSGWRADVVEAIAGDIRPALTRLRAMLHDEILPIARPDERAGICHLAGGAEDYEALLHAATSTHLGSDRVHEIGLNCVAMLEDEYRQRGPTALGVDDPVELRARLRDDPELRYATSEEIMADASAALSRAQRTAPGWFSRLPAAPCTAAATSGPAMAYYTAPSPDGARGGTFFYGVADPSAWTRFNLEVTTFHESVPGHHLQIALALELDLHQVLGELEVTSYGEGWGLYAERLADEMSLYSGPLQQLGMLTLDSMRAARLVVDTGLHARGWTRDQAIDYLADNTALTRASATGEIDRYIADPGQATSYMIGRIELERLRIHAADRLGSRFRLVDFHDAVLGGGMMPLDALAESIDSWIESRPDPAQPVH